MRDITLDNVDYSEIQEGDTMVAENGVHTIDGQVLICKQLY
jgi:hypothetical protein